MKKFRIFTIASLFAASMMLTAVPESYAQRRGERGERHEQSGGGRRQNNGNEHRKNNKDFGSRSDQKHAYRPGNNRPGNGDHKRPNQGVAPNRPQRPDNGHKQPQYRPGANGWNSDMNRPGNRPENNRPETNRPDYNRPGNNHPGNHRPPYEGFRPGNNHPGGPAHRPDYRPGHRPGPGHGPSTVRPGMGMHRPPVAPPPPRPYHPHRWHYAGRPLPPPSWRPMRPAILFSTVLGMNFGLSINLSLDYLYNHGYTVDGYSNNAVYLNDVSQLGMIWPYAQLYYNDYGNLAASEFIYSSPYGDRNRYGAAYNMLVRAYGPPVSVNNVGGQLCAQWWGADNQFITLRFGLGASQGGPRRYYTSLIFGL